MRFRGCRNFTVLELLRHVGVFPYSHFNLITAVKTARWLFHPDLKDRGYQAYRVNLVYGNDSILSGTIVGDDRPLLRRVKEIV